MNKEEVRRIYEKSFLYLSDENLDEQAQKFNEIIEKVDEIFDLDLEGEDYFEITSDLTSPLREDVACESLDREDALKNAKHREYGYFKLERVLD